MSQDVKYTVSQAIMTNIGEMIDNCFGDEEFIERDKTHRGNSYLPFKFYKLIWSYRALTYPQNQRVNIKLLKTILLILARSLNVMERQVTINLPAYKALDALSSVEVAEVNVRTKHRKSEGGRPSTAGRVSIIEGQRTKARRVSKEPGRQSKDGSPSETRRQSNLEKLYVDQPKKVYRMTNKFPFSKRSTQCPSVPQFFQKPWHSSTSSFSESASNKTQKLANRTVMDEIYLTSTVPNIEMPSLHHDKSSRYELLDYNSQMRDSTTAMSSTISDYWKDSTFSSRNISLKESKIQPSKQKRFFYGQSDKTTSTDEEKLIKNTKKKSGKDYVKEKILIVNFYSGESTPIISESKCEVLPQLMVIKEQFNKLTKEVKDIEERILSSTPDENLGVFKGFYKKTTMTQPMALVQLSARLETVENKSNQIIKLLNNLLSKTVLEKNKDRITDAAIQQTQWTQRPLTVWFANVEIRDSAGTELSTQRPPVPTKSEENFSKKYVLEDFFKARCDLFRDTMIKKIPTTILEKSVDIAENVILTATPLHKQLDQCIATATSPLYKLEASVINYLTEINCIDLTLTKLITINQEGISNLQSSLDKGLDVFSEYIANMNNNGPVIAELYNKFSKLHNDFVITNYKQEEIYEQEEALVPELTALAKTVITMEEIKASREEVQAAFDSRVGLRELNSIADINIFDTVFASYVDRIKKAYRLFDNKEKNWQLFIDNALKKWSEKVDITLVNSLEEDIMKHVNNLNEKLEYMFGICSYFTGEDTRYALKNQKNLCLSCDTKPRKKFVPNKANQLRLNKMQGTKTAQNTFSEQNDTPCIFDEKVLHIVDSRSEVCPKFCGHITKNTLESILKEDITIRRLEKKLAETEHNIVARQRPCKPCNQPKRREYVAPKTDKFFESDSMMFFSDNFCWSLG